jgi:hypothetical protein
MAKPKLTARWTAAALAATLFAGAALVGCRNRGSSDSTTASVSRSLGAPTPVPTGATKLTSGPAPLNYMLGSGGDIRVVDLDTGLNIASTNAPPQSVITVQETTGVSVANKTVTPGPLPKGHRYEIWLDRK